MKFEFVTIIISIIEQLKNSYMKHVVEDDSP